MKITDLINQDYCNPEKLMYKNIKSNKLIRDVIGGKVNNFMNKYFYKFNDLFQSQPFWEAPDMTDWLNQTIRNKEFKEIFNLNDDVVI